MNFIAMDFETANAKPYSACSLALVMVRDSRIVGEYYTLIQPETDFFWRNIQIHKIHPQDVVDAPKFPDVWQQINQYFNPQSLIVAHNAAFDNKVLAECLDYYGLDNHHDALEDSRACAQILLRQEDSFGTDPLKKLVTIQ